jgi:hypothetical protein
VTPGAPGAAPGEAAVSPETGAAAAPPTEAFAQAPEAGTQPAASFNPTIFGDLMGLPVNFVPPAGTQITLLAQYPPSTAVTSAATAASQAAQARAAGAGPSLIAAATLPFHTSFKISENETPFPVTRLFACYNYYNDVIGSGAFAGGPVIQVHREVFGGEYAFLGGNASVGIRAPIFETRGGSTNSDDAQFGDLSVVFKYAFWMDRQAGNVLSGGMVVSAPTGPALPVAGQSSVNPTLFQPYLAGQLTIHSFYIQNYSAIVVPTDTRDVTLFFDSVALGYFLYQNDDRAAWLRRITPTAEFHANIPFNHQSLSSSPIGLPPSVDFTGGAYFQFGKCVLGLAAGTPLTGPRLFNVEAIATLNIFF